MPKRPKWTKRPNAQTADIHKSLGGDWDRHRPETSEAMASLISWMIPNTEFNRSQEVSWTDAVCQTRTRDILYVHMYVRIHMGEE